MTPSQKRMTVQSLMGRRSLVYVKVAKPTPLTVAFDVEVIGVGVSLLGDTDKAVDLTCRMYGEDNRWATVPLASVVGMTPLPWPVTDPRHPDYVAPKTVYTALPPRR